MAEDENDWDLWAIVRSCGKMNNSVNDDINVSNTSLLGDQTVHEDPNSANDDVNVNNTDHQSVHEDPTHGNSVNTTQDTTHFPEESHSLDDFFDLFGMEKKRYFGLDEVISLSKNLNTNSRIEPRNQENQTGTTPNTPLVTAEHEEKKQKAKYSKQSSSTESGKVFCDRGKSVEQREIVAEADQWRWKKYGIGHYSTFTRI